MHSVILVLHLILASLIVVLVLLQRAEGGGLGIGGSMGGLMKTQTTTSALAKATGVCGGLFFATSLILAVLATGTSREEAILDAATASKPAIQSEQAPATAGDAAQTVEKTETKSEGKTEQPATEQAPKKDAAPKTAPISE